jgi:hypothetical protein
MSHLIKHEFMEDYRCWNKHEEEGLNEAKMRYSSLEREVVTPGFKARSNAHSMYVQRSSLHTCHKENEYKNINVIIYNNYYGIMSYKRLSRTLSEALQWKDTINPQAIDRG